MSLVQTEVGFLAKLSHPNMVKLLGYCQEEENRKLLIVYEFMKKDSLNYHLFGSKDCSTLLHCRDTEQMFANFVATNIHFFTACFSACSERSDQQLPWETRLMIATEMAQALSYLHSMDRPIIFRDFKTSNILLDEVNVSIISRLPF
jgi:interleukin-1 receptor-associated kinase 1